MPGSLNVKVKDSPVLRRRLFQRSEDPAVAVEVCDAESRFTQVMLLPTLTIRSWWVKFTMSDETPPSFVASGVGVAAGSGVTAGVGVESGLQAAMAAAVAKSAAVRSNALLGANRQAMSGNSSYQSAMRSASRIGVAATPVETQGPRRPLRLHPSDMKDTPGAPDLSALGTRARSSCTRTAALPEMVRSQWPPCALWPSGSCMRSCEGCHKDGLFRSPSHGAFAAASDVARERRRVGG